MARRRYRLFTVLAVVIVFLLFRTLQNSWSIQADRQVLAQPAFEPQAAAPELAEHATDGDTTPPDTPPNTPNVPAYPEARPGPDRVAQKVDVDKGEKPLLQSGSKDEPVELVEPAPSHDAPLEHEPLDGPDDATTTDGQPSEPIPSKVHWKQPKAFYPLPKKSIITLPTAKAKPIPKIQYQFDAESQAAETTRLQRLAAVRKELRRSWAGYKKYAWMHDELRPVTNLSKDPFCGWAATLVDSLDTLWIAGLKDDFDEAAQAVKEIDFTFTQRRQIPVFETVIRYLGGLIGAYDVSGGASGGYGFLLDKAQELAEILIGVFDTPNRMPILYYKWQPHFTNQPQRAGEVGMAELATLSLEFTRLAQLTAQHKYYDAIDRITEALIGLQKQGTLIPGLFPENLDASGCNETATKTRNETLRKAANAKAQKDEKKTSVQGGSWNMESADSAAASFDRSNERPAADDDRLQRRTDDSLSFARQDEVDAALANTRVQETKPKPNPQNSLGTAASSPSENDDPECVPQSDLAPALYRPQNFHVGGAQDSAYEYFPKVSYNAPLLCAR